MKGTAKAITNLKPMAGGVAIAQLPVGGWVFGAKGLTDLTGFDHFYRANGELVELAKTCKATLGNLILSNELETDTPPVDPPPVDPATFDFIEMRRISHDGGLSWTAWEFRGIKVIDEPV
jgi:hypothetical protein